MNERPRSRSRKKRPFPVKAIVVTSVAVLALAGTATGYYIQRGKKYETVFFPHTIINGIDVSHKTTEEVKALIAAGIDDYELTVKLRGGDTETITKEEIELHSVFDGSLEKYLDAQEPMKWWQHRSRETEYEISTMIAFDEEKLQEKIDGLYCFSEEYAKAPTDAYLSDYQSGQGYVIVPEEQGNLLDKEIVEAGIQEAVHNLKTEVALEELDAYVKPAVTAEDESLNALAAKLNQYVNVTVTYQFGDKREVLNGDVTHQWLSVSGDQEVSLSADQVAAYVKQLASQYDTAYKKKTFKTTYGETVTVSPAIYGWRINQSKESAELYNILQSGESQTREPIYSQTANSRGENDYGNTYVEINLTAQHLYFYKDGKLVTESDFVSGNHAKEYDTPAGAYPLTYKQKNATLRGEDYETPVDYWMPFNGNIGMHDASWRSSFGGKIYMTNGSHGCINLPPAVAKKIYENISAGDPVICYHLEGTASGSTSKTQTAGTKTAETGAGTTAGETAAAGAAAGSTAAGAETETTAAGATAAGATAGEDSAAGTTTGGNTASDAESGTTAAEPSPSPTPQESSGTEAGDSGTANSGTVSSATDNSLSPYPTDETSVQSGPGAAQTSGNDSTSGPGAASSSSDSSGPSGPGAESRSSESNGPSGPGEAETTQEIGPGM